jgi:hypothetical protein
MVKPARIPTDFVSANAASAALETKRRVISSLRCLAAAHAALRLTQDMAKPGLPFVISARPREALWASERARSREA